MSHVWLNITHRQWINTILKIVHSNIYKYTVKPVFKEYSDGGTRNISLKQQTILPSNSIKVDGHLSCTAPVMYGQVFEYWDVP